MDPAVRSFSLVTALKDGFADFRATIPTVLGQTDREFEWLVVDDGSAEPVADAFPELARDPRVKVRRLAPGRGQTRALNLGIREAKGDWIVRMDGDDLCAPDRLALLRLAVAERPAAQLVFSDYAVIDEDDRVWAEVRYREPLSASFFEYLRRRNNPLCHPTVAFRRLRPSGEPRVYREDLVNAQDYALWLEILEESGPESFAHVASPTLRYRVVRGSLSGARAPEQAVEKEAIRRGQRLREGEQTRATLGDSERQAMQAYRLLYYRFAGRAGAAGLSEDLALLGAVAPLPALLPKAAFYFLFRPLRRLLLRVSLGGIYD